MTTDTEDNRRNQLVRETTDVGRHALALLRSCTRGQISATDLQQGLQRLTAGQILVRYWDILTASPRNAPCLDVLQLVSSLEQEMESQLLRYGESSLWDDLHELQAAVQRVGK